MIAAARFERGHAGAGALVRHIENMTRAELLARMWTLFGPPDEVSDGGFRYDIRDRETAQEFEVFSGASGPAYGGPLYDRESIEPVLAAFDVLLARAPLADCHLEIPVVDGKLVLGAKNGAPFERS
jgi:hypothetical protein